MTAAPLAETGWLAVDAGNAEGLLPSERTAISLDTFGQFSVTEPSAFDPQTVGTISSTRTWEITTYVDGIKFGEPLVRGYNPEDFSIVTTTAAPASSGSGGARAGSRCASRRTP